MTFTAVAEMLNISVHRVMAICNKYVDEAVKQTDYSQVTTVAIDEMRFADENATPIRLKVTP
jgi:hypothetical protein